MTKMGRYQRERSTGGAHLCQALTLELRNDQCPDESTFLPMFLQL